MALSFTSALLALLALAPSVSPLTDKPPAELAAGVAARLAPAARIVAGPATLEIWLVQQLEKNGDGPGWGSVESGTLVGAMRVSGEFKEIRGKAVKPGVYTLRFGMQPQNGDHLGISTFREFLLISPAAIDQDPKVLGFDGVVALSKEVIGTAHPASLSLDPPEDAPGAPLSTYKNEHGHEGVVLRLGSLTFGLIVSGLIVH
ncbi:MAG TPA: hypothetical protein VFV51_17930 [Vicinamibacterales bacterium]|nr:hypothetical protein [Vicinamibacterales bacterium]